VNVFRSDDALIVAGTIAPLKSVNLKVVVGSNEAASMALVKTALTVVLVGTDVARFAGVTETSPGVTKSMPAPVVKELLTLLAMVLPARSFTPTMEIVCAVLGASGTDGVSCNPRSPLISERVIGMGEPLTCKVTWPVETNEMGPSNIICTNVLVGTLRKLFGGLMSFTCGAVVSGRSSGGEAYFEELLGIAVEI